MKKFKILFVCLGNICRSPLAHEVFKHIVIQNNKADKFEIESCGTSSWHVGSKADKRMRNEAKKHGINMTHLARTLDPKDFEHFDLILAMDLSNLHNLMSKCEEKYKNKIMLFRTFDPKSDEKNLEVPDPYTGDEKAFENVYNMVERTCKNLFDKLVNK
ncbi:MAG: protein tyrosine phosphatase [Clostridiales bacterium]|nr:MAG: protein tyrosine phosphatase [Clostridiales bacterium]